MNPTNKSSRKFQCFLVLVILFLVGRSFDAWAHEDDALSETKALIRTQLTGIAIDRISATKMDGIFELTIKDVIVYYHPKSRITFFGEIWNQQKVNLTQRTKNKLTAIKLENLPLDKAIKIGDGPNVVIEVVDPDCPFCRKTHKFLSKRDDVTRYVFLFPVPSLHPQAEEKSRYILCAENQQKAYEDALTGKFDLTLPEPCEKEEITTLLNHHKEVAKRLNVRGTPALWINNQFVNGADLQMIASLLKRRS